MVDSFFLLCVKNQMLQSVTFVVFIITDDDLLSAFEYQVGMENAGVEKTITVEFDNSSRRFSEHILFVIWHFCSSFI